MDFICSLSITNRRTLDSYHDAILRDLRKRDLRSFRFFNGPEYIGIAQPMSHQYRRGKARIDLEHARPLVGQAQLHIHAAAQVEAVRDCLAHSIRFLIPDDLCPAGESPRQTPQHQQTGNCPIETAIYGTGHLPLCRPQQLLEDRIRMSFDKVIRLFVIGNSKYRTRTGTCAVLQDAWICCGSPVAYRPSPGHRYPKADQGIHRLQLVQTRLDDTLSGGDPFDPGSQFRERQSHRQLRLRHRYHYTDRVLPDDILYRIQIPRGIGPWNQLKVIHEQMAAMLCMHIHSDQAEIGTVFPQYRGDALRDVAAYSCDKYYVAHMRIRTSAR